MHEGTERRDSRQGAPVSQRKDPLPWPIPGLSQEGRQPHGLGLMPIAVSQWERLSGASVGVCVFGGTSLPRGMGHVVGLKGSAFQDCSSWRLGLSALGPGMCVLST